MAKEPHHCTTQHIYKLLIICWFSYGLWWCVCCINILLLTYS